MSDVNLSVAYKSQWDPDASETRDDCGPCSISMNLNYFGENTTTNQVFGKTGAAIDALITAQQMMTAVAAYGYKSAFLTGQTVAQLKAYLDQGLPVIALVHYGAFSSRQDQGFRGGHFFLVVGYRDDGYFINDPDFYAPLRNDGDHHFYTKADFESGWSTASIDGNPNNAYIVISKKTDVPTENVMVPKDTFTKLVTKSTNRDDVYALLGLPADPVVTNIDAPTAVIGGLKNLATGLQRQLGEAQTLASNEKERADRIQQTAETSAKTDAARISALESAQTAWEKERESLKGQLEQFAKDKGNALIEAAAWKTKYDQVVFRLVLPGWESLSLSDLFSKRF